MFCHSSTSKNTHVDRRYQHELYRIKLRSATRVKRAEARKILKELSPNFFNLPFKITIPILDRSVGGNCHGFTVKKSTGSYISGDQITNNLNEKEQVAIFISNGIICHSGLYLGNKLTHYLIGVGVIETHLNENELAGYEARYNLPDDKLNLMQYLDDETTLNDYERVIGYASDANMDYDLNTEFNALKTPSDRRLFLQKNALLIEKIKLALKEKYPYLFDKPT